jgi:hypothetical protein
MKKLLIALTFGLFAVTVAQAGSEGVTKSYFGAGYFAATSKEDLGAVLKYSSKGNKRAIASMKAEGRVFVLQPGMRVQIEESDLLDVRIKCRVVGTEVSFWTTRDAISDDHH